MEETHRNKHFSSQNNDDIFHIFDYIKVLNLEKLDKTQSIISENIIMQKNDFIVYSVTSSGSRFPILGFSSLYQQRINNKQKFNITNIMWDKYNKILDSLSKRE